ADGRKVVTASQDCTAGVWDTETKKVIALLRGHLKDVNSASFSPDCRWVVTASSDQTARLWDAQHGHEMGHLKGHNAQVRSATFSHDGLRVLTGSSDRTARLWDVSRTLAFTGDRAVFMAAGLAGTGRRTLTERSDLLLQDAPDNLFAAIMKELPDRAAAVSKTVGSLAAPLHSNCYLSPTDLATLLPDSPEKRRIDRIAIAATITLLIVAGIAFSNQIGLPILSWFMDLIH